MTERPGNVTLSQLVKVEEQGISVNRLLFAKFLVSTRRIGRDDRAPDIRRVVQGQPSTVTFQPEPKV